jgi:predicted nuclease of predicted toxin-antitoxin system
MSQSSIRFLIDEDTSHSIRDGLQRRQPEIEVLVIGGVDAPLLSTRDEEILKFIEREGYILITSDLGMPVHLQTHRQAGGHVPGILTLRPNFSYGQIIDELELIWFAGVPEDFQDQLRHIPL